MSSSNKHSTPFTRTPSIVQQRAVLVVFFLMICAVLWWQGAAGSAAYPVQKLSLPPVPDVIAELDFTDAEASWSDLRVDPHGNLLIDTQTESALSEALALMHDQGIELQMARTALLLEKQFGESTSQQFMALLPIVKDYKEIEQRWWEENASRHPPPYEELFQLQDQVLGESLAASLFSEQRRLAELMLASYQIQMDTSLTQAQKDQSLMDLQNTFQKGASIEPKFSE